MMDAGLEELDLQGDEETKKPRTVSIRAATAMASTLLQSGAPP
ncbi:unnamed protein product, partial [Ectocarpus sp. 8 AP-2014]